MITFKFREPPEPYNRDGAKTLEITKGDHKVHFYICHPISLLWRDVRSVFHKQARIQFAKLERSK